MPRIIHYLFTAILTFAVGIGTNGLVNRGGDLASRFIIGEPLSNLTPPTFLEEPEVIPPGFHACTHLMVIVNDDRTLHLNTMEVGSLDDTSKLTTMLEQIFKERTKRHVYKSGVDLTSDVPEDERIERTVFIKAPRKMSYGEMSDLIEEIKAAGANPIGLVNERPLYR